MGRISDNELYQLVQEQNKEALEQLYDRYEGLLFSFSFKILNRKELAEEAVQDVFMTLWRKKRMYKEEKGKFSSWLLTVTRNSCLDLLRKQTNNQVELLEHDMDQKQAESTEETVIWNEDRKSLKQAVSTLTVEQQEIVNLFYFKGCSQSQIAEQKHLPLGTIKGRIRLALKHLRKVYAERGKNFGE